jgi:hypothetical protein
MGSRPGSPRITGSPAEAARGAGIVLTMLSDTGAVLSAMEGEYGALGAMDGEAVWLQMSTIGEEGTERCERLAAAQGITFVTRRSWVPSSLPLRGSWSSWPPARSKSPTGSSRCSMRSASGPCGSALPGRAPASNW